MKKFLFLLSFVLVSINQTAFSEEISTEKKALIDKVLEQTGQSSIATGQQFMNLFIQQITMALQANNPDIDPKAYKIVEQEIQAVISEEMIKNKALEKLMHPIYDKYYTTEDLKSMVELYNSPFGKKMLEVMPAIAQEGMQVGQVFGQSLGPKIQQRIAASFEQAGIK